MPSSMTCSTCRGSTTRMTARPQVDAHRRDGAVRRCCARTCWPALSASCGEPARSRPNARLLGDEPEIHSAFSNLVDNAAKYTPASGRDHAFAGPSRRRWQCPIRACRTMVPGIAPEHLPRLTERFYRVDSRAAPARPAAPAWASPSSSTCCMHHGATLDVQSTAGRRQSTFSLRVSGTPRETAVPTSDFPTQTRPFAQPEAG